jgi:hypothetical protein
MKFPQMGKERFIDPDTYVFSFGKYRDSSYEEIFKDDPQYILWCHEEIDSFTLTNLELDRVMEKIDYDGLEGYYKNDPDYYYLDTSNMYF